MSLIKYWTISVTVSEAKSSLTLQQMRDEMYLSPSVKLAGMNGMAHIESQDLAYKFLDGCRPVLDARYKSGYEVAVQECCGSKHKSLLERIENDSSVVKARVETKNFVSNRKVEIH